MASVDGACDGILEMVVLVFCAVRRLFWTVCSPKQPLVWILRDFRILRLVGLHDGRLGQVCAGRFARLGEVCAVREGQGKEGSVCVCKGCFGC